MDKDLTTKNIVVNQSKDLTIKKQNSKSKNGGKNEEELKGKKLEK